MLKTRISSQFTISLVLSPLRHAGHDTT